MMLRSFIAVEIPTELQGILAHRIAPLQQALPKPLIRWTASHNVHLTLKFLGDISPANLERLAEALKTEVAACEAFTMSVGGLGAFPNPRRARILWIGLDAPSALKVLLRSVESVSARLGYSSEDRPFSPHLTIGRVGQNVSGIDLQRIHTALEGTKVDIIGTVHVGALQIFRSDLQPGGSVYTRLYNLPLNQSNETR
jgi:RNA 2',3'-cyclic 3'-phosphodiesterase